MYRALFSADAYGNTNLLCIMTQRVSEDKYNTFVLSMSNSLKIEPNVLIVTRSKQGLFGLFSSESQEIQRVPVTMTPEDMRLMSDFFDQVIYERFMRYFDARDRLSMVGAVQPATFPGFTDILAAVSQTYDVVFKLFSSSSKTELVQAYTSLGFSHYDGKASITYYIGVSADKIDRLKSLIVRSLSIPADKVDAFADYIDFADCLDASAWTNVQSLLRTDNSGETKAVQVFFNRDLATNKYNVFVTDVIADF